MLASTLDEYSRLLWYPSPLLSSFRLLQPDGGSQEPDDATPADYYYYQEGALFYMEPADDQE